MKPLLLHGHERAITQIKYNREGDLLFSCSKDHQPNIWYSLNGERLGTLQGHTGTVWSIDVNWETTKVVTGGADNCTTLWDCKSGVAISTLKTRTAVRTCAFSYSGRQLMFSTDNTMKQDCDIYIIDVNNFGKDDLKPVMKFTVDNSLSKVTSCLWGPLDKYIITGHNNGSLRQWDLSEGKEIACVDEHKQCVNDMQYNKDQTMFITASKDTKAKLFDTKTLECLKTYSTERPVNSAAISPIRDHVILGGGQEAGDVTTTSTKAGKFEARLFHLIFEEEFGRIKGHFGPINSVAFHPDGKSYSSGGEDGYVRVHSFDPQYFNFKFDY